MDFVSGGLGHDAEIAHARPVPGAGPRAVDRFLSLQHSISSGMTAAELEAMKFLCRDKIRKRKLETVRSGLELFSILMEQQVVAHNNLGFLKELLQHISRGDLLSLVVQFEQGELRAPDDDQPDEHEKRLLKAAFDVICANVGREWKKLMRELGLPEVKLDKVEAAYRFDLEEEVFQALREWQKWKGKDAKVADLIKALQNCNLKLVADRVEEKISQVSTGTN
ncbi:FAS-associated death domain protein [Pyrgilauda ruficollis]|uniref:FAS-associated death domain protein n=1 Tax=Pyrgilauda ruficollis TaxID=221976 RepID=UPI001B85ED1B|nr:FAS-associated death domain protein [Pyrgilauda ruficollis]